MLKACSICCICRFWGYIRKHLVQQIFECHHSGMASRVFHCQPYCNIFPWRRKPETNVAGASFRQSNTRHVVLPPTLLGQQIAASFKIWCYWVARIWNSEATSCLTQPLHGSALQIQPQYLSACVWWVWESCSVLPGGWLRQWRCPCSAPLPSPWRPPPTTTRQSWWLAGPRTTWSPRLLPLLRRKCAIWRNERWDPVLNERAFFKYWFGQRNFGFMFLDKSNFNWENPSWFPLK